MSGLSRRRFLQVSTVAGGGLLAGFSLFSCKSESPGGKPSGATSGDTPEPTPSGEPAQVNAWIRIDPDGTITCTIAESEMGQGVLTSMPMILAEELSADWSKVRSEHAPSNMKFGRQGTGGSTSIRRGFDAMRKAGAAVREMLIAAAAQTWGTRPSECRAENGIVYWDGDDQRASFGELAARAATLTPPDDPKLSDKKDYKILGQRKQRLDVLPKTDGTAVYGIDVKVDGMLIGQVARCPIFGGKLSSFDDAAAKKVPGVRHVVEIPTGVAVLADHYWAAHQGREALSIEWDDAGNGKMSSASIRARCKKIVGKGAVAHEKGKGAKGAKLKATYEVPYLAHAPMEPLNATAHVQKDKAELWVPTQAPTRTHDVAAEITGLPRDSIALSVTMLGGGFGRRSQTDFAEDAIHASKAVGKPVKVIWSREDDVRGGWYRPMAYNELAGTVSGGTISHWVHRIASPSIIAGSGRGPLKGGIDPSNTEGAANLPYAIPNMLVTYANPEIPISTWWWRSVGSSQNAYVTECFFDELAAAAKADPFELRRKLLSESPRHKKVLELAADKADWGKPLPEGHARGIAVHMSFGSYCAQVADVSIENGAVRVHRVVVAIDAGGVINPDTIEAQMESAIAYGLSAALYGDIAIEDGRAAPGNFDTYPVLKLREMPRVDTHIVDSGEALGGIGEPGLPPIAPAVVNGLFALTKKPIRTLPISIG